MSQEKEDTKETTKETTKEGYKKHISNFIFLLICIVPLSFIGLQVAEHYQSKSYIKQDIKVLKSNYEEQVGYELTDGDPEYRNTHYRGYLGTKGIKYLKYAKEVNKVTGLTTLQMNKIIYDERYKLVRPYIFEMPDTDDSISFKDSVKLGREYAKSSVDGKVFLFLTVPYGIEANLVDFYNYMAGKDKEYLIEKNLTKSQLHNAERVLNDLNNKEIKNKVIKYLKSNNEEQSKINLTDEELLEYKNYINGKERDIYKAICSGLEHSTAYKYVSGTRIVNKVVK